MTKPETWQRDARIKLFRALADARAAGERYSFFSVKLSSVCIEIQKLEQVLPAIEAVMTRSGVFGSSEEAAAYSKRVADHKTLISTLNTLRDEIEALKTEAEAKATSEIRIASSMKDGALSLGLVSKQEVSL